MRGPKPVKVKITPRQHAVLKKIIRRETCHQRDLRRARIILAAGEGLNNQQIAERYDITRDASRLWRERWYAAKDLLFRVEQEEDDAALEKLILNILADEPRPGGPVTFSPEQICQIIAVACESPEESSRSVTHWTPRELAEEVIKRGIVESISTRSIGRFLKRGRPQASPKPLLAEQ